MLCFPSLGGSTPVSTPTQQERNSGNYHRDCYRQLLLVVINMFVVLFKEFHNPVDTRRFSLLFISYCVLCST